MKKSKNGRGANDELFDFAVNSMTTGMERSWLFMRFISKKERRT
jgi:hypothetical protein